MTKREKKNDSFQRTYFEATTTKKHFPGRIPAFVLIQPPCFGSGGGGGGGGGGGDDGS